jgi:hypothetical protein
MSIAGQVYQAMLAGHSHVRIAKRKALEALAAGAKAKGYSTNRDTKIARRGHSLFATT